MELRADKGPVVRHQHCGGHGTFQGSNVEWGKSMIIDFQDETHSVPLNFLQTLVLLYLPCEKFSVSQDDQNNRLKAVLTNRDGKWRAHVRLMVGEDGSQGEQVETDGMTQKDLSQILLWKVLLGRAFLQAAEKIFGFRPPWGILTGIRPVKIALPFLEAGEDRQAVISTLQNIYAVSPEKAKLCVETAIRERALTKGLANRSCSLYVSIPFCPTKCRYCSFVSFATPRLLSLIPEYLASLKRELRDIAEVVRSLNLTLCTIYIGGGTPAVLTADGLADLFETIAELFSEALLEYTFEAGRPDCVTKEKLALAKQAGVTRVSINTQTANDAVLAAIGRNHTFEDYLNAFGMTRNAGFHCINTDLIAALPGESFDSFCQSVDRVLSVGPENITIHSFTLKKSSEYKQCVLTRGRHPVGPATDHDGVDGSGTDWFGQDACRMVQHSCDTLCERGYLPYYIYRQKNTAGNLDNTGYALPGTESLYNVYMMGEYHTVFAAGAGGVTKLVSESRERISRLSPPKYPYEYLDGTKYAGFPKEAVYQFYETYSI